MNDDDDRDDGRFVCWWCYDEAADDLEHELAEAKAEIARHHALILEMRELLDNAADILGGTGWLSTERTIREFLNREVGD